MSTAGSAFETAAASAATAAVAAAAVSSSARAALPAAIASTADINAGNEEETETLHSASARMRKGRLLWFRETKSQHDAAQCSEKESNKINTIAHDAPCADYIPLNPLDFTRTLFSLSL